MTTSPRGIGTPSKHFRRFDDRFDAIVVGSGMGGLGVAALLAKLKGLRVLVLERHFTAGGFTHVFRRPGFEWDVGVHYVGQFHQHGSPFTPILEYITEGRLTWQAMPDVYDRIVIGDQSFDYPSGPARLKASLIHCFPREERAISAYFAAVSKVVRWAPFFYSEKALPSVLSGVIGSTMRAPFLTYARRTTREVLDAFGASPLLRAVLTGQYGDYGLPPQFSSFAMHALTTSHYWGGAAYPVGGGSAIARSLLPTIERPGGALVVDAEVTRILLDGTRAAGIRLRDGREVRANIVVSAAGLPPTVRMVPEWGAMTGWASGAALPAAPSPAHVGLYVGLRADPAAPPLVGTNLWVHPTPHFEQNWQAFAEDLDAPLPCLFLSFPSAKDPSFDRRYPGHETIEVLSLAPYQPFAKWADRHWKHRGADYDQLKARLAERLLCALKRHVPGASDRIVATEVSTPLSTRHFTNHAEGEIYGLAHTPARFADRRLGARTPFRGLFLTGQDITICSIAGAFVGATITASAILGRNLYVRIPRD